MSLPVSIREYQFDDFTLATLRKLDKKEATDIVTPRTPLWRRLEQGKTEGRGIVEEPPGQGPVRDVYYKTPDRGVTLSRSNPMVNRVHTPHESNTQAQYDWLMRLDTLTIPMYEKLNTLGADAVKLINWLERKRRGINIQHRTKLNYWLWNGATDGSYSIFGLNDLIQFDPTSDPSRGSPGKLTVTDISEWANKYANYNTYCMVYSSGAQTQSFLDYGTSSLQKLYSDCGYYTGNDDDLDAYPDLIVCNQPYYRACVMAASHKLLFVDSKDVYQLGVEGFRYRGATIIEDRSVPDDPNTSTYGVAFLINTRMIDVVFAQGIRGIWMPSRNLNQNTATAMDKATQMSVACRARNRLGVHYGVIPTVSAS